MMVRHLFRAVAEIAQTIESLGEITTPEHRSATRGGVWLRALTKHGQPMVLQWISTPLPGESAVVQVRETPFSGSMFQLGGYILNNIGPSLGIL